MLVVVGGNSRKVGKTALVEALIRENVEAEWTAIKIAGHVHAAAKPRNDTARYLAAGAKLAYLFEAPEIAARIDEIRAAIAASRNTIVESNRILDYVTPDVCLLVVDTGRASKPSFVALGV